MRIFTIRKHSGGHRTIYAPSRDEKALLRELLNEIAHPQNTTIHGFVHNRNVVTNAAFHTSYPVTINMDLSSFFDSVKPSMVKGMVSSNVIKHGFLNEEGRSRDFYEVRDDQEDFDFRARQGLPTSPLVANIAARSMDAAIHKRLLKMSEAGSYKYSYTRYADDLSISLTCTNQDEIEIIISEIKQIVSRCGFKVNPKKTRVQRATGGRREVCGLTVDNEIHTPRHFRRKLRAAIHNLTEAIISNHPEERINSLWDKFRGLEEASKLKFPIPFNEKQKKRWEIDAAKFAKAFKLRWEGIQSKEIPDMDLGNGCYITNDPLYFYGISDFTDGWVSCMSQRRSCHSYRKGVAFWYQLKGCSVAYQTDGVKIKVGGVSRPRMVERILVFKTIDGKLRTGERYSNRGHRRTSMSNPISTLERKLRDTGFTDPTMEDTETQVIGYVHPDTPVPFFDMGSYARVRMAESGRIRSKYKIR